MNTLPVDLFGEGWFTTDSEDELEQAKINYWKQDDSEYVKEHTERDEAEDCTDEEEIQSSEKLRIEQTPGEFIDLGGKTVLVVIAAQAVVRGSIIIIPQPSH